MLKIFFLTCSFTFFNSIMAQDSTSFRKLPLATQTTLKNIANTYSVAAVDRSKIKNAIFKSRLDFANMDINTLVQMVMMMIEAENREDLRQALEEMEEFNKRKAAIRDYVTETKKENDSLRNALRSQYVSDSSRLALKIRNLQLHIKSVENASKPKKLEKLKQD